MIHRLALSALLLATLAGSALAQDSSGKTDLGGQPPPPPGGLGPRAAAPAPNGAPPPPQIETVATHNGWTVQCETVPAQGNQPANKACGMSRALKSEQDQTAVLVLIVRRVKAEDGKLHTLMEARAPIGVYLPTGVAMEIDGTAIAGRMPFVRCLPQICEAQGEAQDGGIVVTALQG